MKKIAVLTSGGDAPGMNSALSAVYQRCQLLNIELVGVMDGFKGMYEGDYFTMTQNDVDQISSMGGTILKSSRFIEFKQEDYVLRTITRARKEGIEGVLVIGGDGSFRGVKALSEFGMNCIGIPGTIDNDIPGTCYTIGFDSALNTIVEAIDQLKDTARSHHRCLIVEVMGRHCNDLAIHGAVSGQVDGLITSDMSVDVNKLSQTLQDTIEEKGYSIILVSENVLDVQVLAKQLEQISKVECRGIVLGYLQRGGKPSASDRILATRCAIHAVNALNEGMSNACTCLQNNEIVLEKIDKALDVDYHNKGIYEDYKWLR